MTESTQIHTYEEAREALPEEQKRQLEKEIKQLRSDIEELIRLKEDTEGISDEWNAFDGSIESLTAELNDAKERLAKLGGESRQCLRKVLSAYDIEEDSRWFVEGYRNFEQKMFKEILLGTLSERFGDVSGLIVDDRGMGTGRTLRMLLDVVREEKGQRKAQQFAKNLHGIDLMPKNLEQAHRTFKEGRYGVPAGNTSVGSFLEDAEVRRDTFKGKKAHLITCMMHSSFYNTTEEDWCRFLTNVRDDLEVGGLFVFDTVAMRNVEPETIEKNADHFDDMRDLYTQLWFKYCEENQAFMSEGVDLRRMPRFPIYDNTTGKGFYWREVPNISFLMHLIQQIGGGLSLEAARMRKPQLQPKEALKIGRRWIAENGFEKKIRAEMRRRITEGISDAGRILGRPLKKRKQKSAATMEALLNHVALSMVLGYQNHYIIMERDPENSQK